MNALAFIAQTDETFLSAYSSWRNPANLHT